MNLIEKFTNTATNYYWGLTASAHEKTLSPEQKAQVKLVAHRGVHGEDAKLASSNKQPILENSHESFDLAVQNKIWGIEFDVRFTKDGIPVVHHDPHCERLYSCSAIIEHTDFKTLIKQVPQIPTLQEVVEKYARKTHLLIEIKESITPSKNAALKSILEPLTPKSDYHLLTLDADFLKPINFAPPAAIMAVDWMDMETTIRKATALKFGAVSGHFMLLNDERLNSCKHQNLITGTGFIETKGALIREINRGIDWIFTNHPLRLKAYLA